MKAVSSEEYIQKGKLRRLYWHLTLPASLSLFILGLYHFVDGIFVGQLVGPVALGAVGIVYPFTLINNGIFSLIGVGSASLLSRAIGAKNDSIIDKIFGNLLILNILLSGIEVLFGFLFSEEIVRFLGGGGGLLEPGVAYLRAVLLGAVSINFASSMNVVIRAEGKMRDAMLILSSGAVLNIILDPIFLGIFNMGVRGAGLATSTAQTVTAIVCIIYFLSGKSVMQPKRCAIRLTRHVGEILSIGFSGMALPVMSIVQIALILRATVQYGDQKQLISISAAIKILNFIFVPIWGSCQGFQPVAGINYGGGNYLRVRQGFFVYVAYTTLIALGIWTVTMLWTGKILSWFITDPLLVREGVRVLRLYFCTYPLYGYMLLVVTLFQAIGKGLPAAFLVVSRMSLIFIPMITLLPRIIGLDGVWLATPAADMLVITIGSLMVSHELIRQKRLAKQAASDSII